MTRRVVVLLVLTAVVLAGCLGGPGTETQTAEPTADENTPNVSSEQVPGVTNGELANATALARANEAELTANGGIVEVRKTGAFGQATYRLDVSAGRETYALSVTRPDGTGASPAIEIWSNETTQFMRSTTSGEPTYRTLNREQEQLTLLEDVEESLAAGKFSVANETTGDGTIVLTAAEVDPSADSHGQFTNVDSFSGRLVVDGDGVIHNLSVSATTASETITYHYQSLQTGVDHVSQPNWVDDVPASAMLQPELTVDVENSSYLAITNEGGDHVPRNAIVHLSTEDSNGTASLETALETGDTRYAYVAASTGEVVISDDRPATDAVDPVTSPVSVSIRTDDGVSLYSASMGWASESASASETGSSGGSDSASGGSASAGGASGATSSAEKTG